MMPGNPYSPSRFAPFGKCVRSQLSPSPRRGPKRTSLESPSPERAPSSSPNRVKDGGLHPSFELQPAVPGYSKRVIAAKTARNTNKSASAPTERIHDHP
jgi:hypothetical protein